MKYEVGDCVLFDSIAGIVTTINIQGNFIQYGVEKYYKKEFRLAGWDWISEKDIIGKADKKLQKEIYKKYKETKEEYTKKGYPKSRFIDLKE